MAHSLGNAKVEYRVEGSEGQKFIEARVISGSNYSSKIDSEVDCSYLCYHRMNVPLHNSSLMQKQARKCHSWTWLSAFPYACPLYKIAILHPVCVKFTFPSIIYMHAV